MGFTKFFSSLNPFTTTRKRKRNTKKQKQKRKTRTKRRFMRGG